MMTLHSGDYNDWAVCVVLRIVHELCLKYKNKFGDRVGGRMTVPIWGIKSQQQKLKTGFNPFAPPPLSSSDAIKDTISLKFVFTH